MASNGGKRKVWTSDRSVVDNGRDISPRLNLPWWKSPMYKANRLKKAEQLRGR